MERIISLAAPRGLVWKQLEAAGDWCVRFHANDGVVFAYVLDGGCLFQAGGSPQVLNEGDLVLLVRPPIWTLGNREGATPREHHLGSTGWERVGTGEGPPTRTVGGRLLLDEAGAGVVGAVLAPITFVRGAGRTGRIRSILDLLGDEARNERPCRSLALERLLELLLIEAARDPHGPSRPGHSTARVLAEPRLRRALLAMHADASRRWTVAALAAEAGMSRSNFAAAFAAAAGRPPIDYLIDWRMALAKRLLRAGGCTIPQIADALGYGSAAAFSAAFIAKVGEPPSRFATRAAGAAVVAGPMT